MLLPKEEERFLIQNSFNTLRKIHLAQILGPCAFIGVALFISADKTKFFSLSEPFSFLVLALPMAILVPIMGQELSKKMKMALLDKSNFAEKIGAYNGASILSWASIESPILLSIVLFRLSQNLVFLVLSAILILLLFSKKPTRQKMASEMLLTDSEAAEL